MFNLNRDTHQRDDHSGGNAKMLAMNAEVVSHRNARANMALLNAGFGAGDVRR